MDNTDSPSKCNRQSVARRRTWWSRLTGRTQAAIIRAQTTRLETCSTARRPPQMAGGWRINQNLGSTGGGTGTFSSMQSRRLARHGRGLEVMRTAAMAGTGLWTYTGTAFGTTVRFADGTDHIYRRRERPHLVFADAAHPRAPTHLSSGVVYGGTDASFTLLQPIATT